MTKRFKYKQGRWKRYNAWRAKHRALDRERRLQNIQAKKQASAADYVPQLVSMPRAPRAWVRVRVYFSNGQSAGFSIRRTPWGQSVSATLAGRKLSALLRRAQASA